MTQLQIFETKVLMKIFRPKKVEVSAQFKIRVQNEKLRDTHRAFGNVNVVKSRRLRWIGHVSSFLLSLSPSSATTPTFSFISLFSKRLTERTIINAICTSHDVSGNVTNTERLR
jgi:hypothetical protein